jgi:proteasome lid subunit RPN8/RPN11
MGLSGRAAIPERLASPVMMAAVRIQKGVLEAIRCHAQAESPLECCGLLSGEAVLITRHHPMRNIVRSESRYEIDSLELFQFFRDLRVTHRKHLGIYHSHPHSEAYPSAIDIQQSFYPECAHFIVSLKDFGTPRVRAFRVVDQSVQELEIVDEA